MNWNDILDELITVLQPEQVPIDYIIMAKLIHHDGTERTIRGEELVSFMAFPEKIIVKEARVILDIRKIRRTMHGCVTIFFDNLTKLTKNG